MQARLLASGVSACTYDRAGGGWSEASTQAPLAQNAAAELLAALGEIGGAAKSVVLVAHSYGAMVAQAAAVLEQDRIGALVLLDPSYAEEIAVERPPPERLALLMPFLAPAGLLRLRSLFAFNEKDPAFPAEVRAEAAALAKQTRHMLAFGREIRSVRASSAWLALHPLAFGAKPLMVIGRDGGGATLAERHRYQRLLAKKSTQGRFEIAPGSDHFIHADAPDLVYQRIMAVAARVAQAQELNK